jgi:hypothetical protein
VRVTVVGQKGDGPVLQRTVTVREFFAAFGPYAKPLWDVARAQTVVIEGHLIRLVVVP